MKKIVGLMLLLGCGAQAPRYKPANVTTSSLTETRLQILDDRFDNDALCEDYQLTKELIASVQNTDKIPKFNDKCPSDYRDFVSMTKDAIQSLRDLHSQVLFGNGLDTQSIAIIKNCQGSSHCNSLIGSPVYPVASSVSNAFFAASFAAATEILPWEIITIDGNKPLSYKDEMDRDLLYSHTKGNWSSQLSAYLLQRDAISSRSRADLHLRVRDIRSGEDVQLVTSFESVQTVFANKDSLDTLQNMSFDRAYGCVDVMKGSTAKIGACRTADAGTIAWLGEWPQLEEFQLWAGSLASWIAKDEAIVKLDLRSNTGGSPISVLNFFCTFGDKAALDVIDGESLTVRSWPNSFELTGGLLRTDKLELLDNLDLLRIDPDFAMDAGRTHAPRSFSMNTWTRAKMTRSGCEAMRLSGLSAMKWKILTDGNEFSAAEDFLFIAQQAKTKFEIYGKPSVGASGNPIWTTLPHTKTGIRLSTSRTLFQSKIIIEKKGVTPDVAIDAQETSKEFQARLKSVANHATLMDFSKDRRSAALRREFFDLTLAP